MKVRWRCLKLLPSPSRVRFWRSLQHLFAGSIYLELVDYTCLDRVRVLINGREMGRMSSSRVKLYVTAGDVLEIDTQAYNHPITLKITSVSSNLAFPKEGMTFTSDQAVTMVGKVRVK